MIRKYYKTICGTEAMPIIVKGWSELLRLKLTPTSLWAVSHDDEAVVAFDGDKTVGVISFAMSKWNRECVIKLGWVEPAYRRKGIYTQLWKMVVKRAQEEEMPTITSGTAISNHALRAFAKGANRIETRVLIDYAVPGVK